MGRCRYCGKDAGLLSGSHAACERRLQDEIDAYIAGTRELSSLKAVAGDLNATGANGADAFLDRWDGAVERTLNDGVLTADEEQRLMSAAELFGLGQPELDRRGKFTRLVQAAVLRDVLDGKVPNRVRVEGVGVNLQKNETIVWVFQDVEYQTLRTQRSFQGVSHGLSIRIMKGVYYRPSAFRGAPVESTSVVSAGRGALIVASKNLYFVSSAKSVRIPYRKVITFQPYSDGLGVQRDGVTARPELLKLRDGWFAYNLVTNLAQLAS